MTVANPTSKKKTTSHRRQELVPIANELVECLSRFTGDSYEWNKQSFLRMLHFVKTGALINVLSMSNEKEKVGTAKISDGNSSIMLHCESNFLEENDENVDSSNIMTLDKVIMPVPVKQRGKPSGMAITHVSRAGKKKNKSRKDASNNEKRSQIVEGSLLIINYECLI